MFDHNWENVVRGQFMKYPNPHNQAVLATDVIDRKLDHKTGVLHSHRIIASDWGLAAWVQSLIGANRTCYAHEYSTVNPNTRELEMTSVNLTFCSFVAMKEKMSYKPHPDDPDNRTLMRQETEVTVQGVPLTSYMESLIVNTVSANSSKGKIAIDWIVDKLPTADSATLDKFKVEVADMKHLVEDTIIQAAKVSIEEIQSDLSKIQSPIIIQAKEEEEKPNSEVNCDS